MSKTKMQLKSKSKIWHQPEYFIHTTKLTLLYDIKQNKMETVKISKTNSSISIYYFTRACSAILLLHKYPSIALRQSRHDCSCCVNVNGKILKIIFLIISILSGSSGSLFPTPPIFRPSNSCGKKKWRTRLWCFEWISKQDAND